jgi:hypothetical protein
MAAVCAEKIVLLDPNNCSEVQSYFHQSDKIHIVDGFIIFWDKKQDFWSILDITGHGVLQTLKSTPVLKQNWMHIGIIADFKTFK